MPLIWCSISAHGLGHAAQIVPVLNALAQQVPNLQVILRTEVPRRFFESRLQVSWELSPAVQDIGCVQRGPLQIDLDATRSRHLAFHADWEARVAHEVLAIQAKQPDLVLSDISYLAIEAGSRAQIATVALGSLSWDVVLEPFLAPDDTQGRQVLAQMREAYRKAAIMSSAPGMALPAFRRIEDVGPITEPTVPDPARLRKEVGAQADEQIALVGFGGVPLESLPFEHMAEMPGFRFIVGGPTPQPHPRVIAAEAIPLPFRLIMASADVIITKPGYATVVEAVAARIPVVYVRRYQFADEAGLVEYLHRYGQAAELSAADFIAGRWEGAIMSALAAPPPRHEAPAPTGASEAARILEATLRAQG